MTSRKFIALACPGFLFCCLAIAAPLAAAEVVADIDAQLAVTAVQDRGAAPAVQPEFRGVWVATVENIDWPSRPGLPGDKQQQEMIAILDKCVELNLNAVIFQIRTQAD